jgi:hypothetical protein
MDSRLRGKYKKTKFVQENDVISGLPSLQVKCVINDESNIHKYVKTHSASDTESNRSKVGRMI